MRSQPLSPKDWQLLSEYMDGQLSPRDKNRLEQRLNEHADLRVALEELRRTRAVLRSVKLRRVPRSFTLTPAMLPQPRANPFSRLAWGLNFASAASAIALAVVLAVGLLPGLSVRTTARTAQEAPANMQSAPAAAPFSAEATPMIIQWSRPLGMGGGGGPETMSADAVAQPELDMGIVPPAAAAPLPQEKALPEATSAPEMGLEAAPAAPAPALSVAPTEGLRQAEPTAAPDSLAQAPLEGAAPLLGVRPAAEAAATNQAAIQIAQEEIRANRPGAFPWLAATILALIAVASWITARILGRLSRS